jgi:GTP-binding protein
VGKSTLFNRLVGGRAAIVDDRPGVTRDRNFAPASWDGRDFWLVDTGGWIAGEDDHLSQAIRHQILHAIDEADVIAFVVDTQEGMHPLDEEVARLLQPHRDKVLLVANKADELAGHTGHLVFHALGLGDPEPVSAATGRGTGDLLDRLVARLPESREPTDQDAINVAVIGRPNVGKSSLVNRLLGEERVVVAPEAGTTRDAVDSPLRYQGETLNFIDTAGLRRRAKVQDEIEFYSNLRSQRAVERADVCVLVVDATSGVHVQELRIAKAAWDRGTGLIIAVNKWDLIPEKDADTARRGQLAVVERAPFLEAVPFVYVSALTGQRVRRILDLILTVAAARSRRIPTADLNRVLRALVERNQPPQSRGRDVRLLYASQPRTQPPTIAIVSNYPKEIPESYRRYLERGFREVWPLEGTPIHFKFRQKKGRRR